MTTLWTRTQQAQDVPLRLSSCHFLSLLLNQFPCDAMSVTAILPGFLEGGVCCRLEQISEDPRWDVITGVYEQELAGGRSTQSRVYQIRV